LQAAEAAITALGQARLEAAAEFNRQALDDLAKARQKGADFLQEEIKAAQRTGLQVLRAPVDGSIEQLAVHTVGGVVSPAQTLLVVVPDGSKLEVEAMLPNRDVGFVQPDQEVEVKIEALTYTRYGLLRGRVEGVSRDTLRSERDPSAASGRSLEPPEGSSTENAPRDESSYVARVSLERTTIETEQGERTLEPGMAVTAEIKTGRRRIISYLLSPLLRYKHESLHER
jgi:hemolysin D